MKVSKSLIAAAVVALLPLAAIAGDKDKTMTQGADQASAQFNMLDADRDGRISRTEAASDSKIVFTEADKNGDGYLDSGEYLHRNGSKESMPNSNSPASDTDTPRKY